MAAQIETWNNVIAQDNLKKFPDGHRGYNKIIGLQLKDTILGGRWDPNQGTIDFTRSGACIDGRTRTQVIASLPDGVNVPVMVQKDFPDDVLGEFGLYQAKRTWGHALAYRYPDQGSTTMNIVASTANMIHAYRGPGTLADFSQKMWTYPVMLDFVQRWDDSLITAVRHAQRINRAEKNLPGGITTPETMAFVLWFLRKEKDAPTFFLDLAQRSSHVMNNQADPRTRLVRHYSKLVFDLNRQPRRNSYHIRNRRIAELLGCWHAHQNNLPWDAWSGFEIDFKHPAVSKADRKKLGWP